MKHSHEIVWSQPSPFWNDPRPGVRTAERTGFETPSILRFSSDSFMEEFLAVLENAPARIAEYRVRPETWRGFGKPPEAATPLTSPLLRRLGLVRKNGVGTNNGSTTNLTITAPPQTPLKIYQPAHQRHYLITSCLVCKTASLPDRTLAAGDGERASFILRRLLPPAGNPGAEFAAWKEHAWVAGEHGFTWQQIADESREKLFAGEETLPMFAVQFTEPGKRRRRLFAAVLPAGKRETYLGAPQASGGGTAPGVTAVTARKVLLRKEVIEPWRSLITRAAGMRLSLTGPFFGEDRAPTIPERAARLKIDREQFQTLSWLILLDLAKFLATHVPAVWEAVLSPEKADDLPPPQRTVFDALEAAEIGEDLIEAVQLPGVSLWEQPAVPANLRQALAKYGSAPSGLNTALEQTLENVDQPYDRANADRRALWPDFLFPLADPEFFNDAPVPPLDPIDPLSAEEEADLQADVNQAKEDLLERLDRLTVLLVRALDPHGTEPAPAVPIAAIAPANALTGRFAVRCVYERPACSPAHHEVLSAPTEDFEIAGFFDPDAPARPIRIGLPIDTSPAGQRKFDKNTAVVISDTLCGQLGRLRGITLGDLVLSVLPWPFHKDLPSLAGDGAPCKGGDGLSLGMICSLSIPIVTLCALILLIIMVALFDFIFRWLPFFVFCFPLPGLKAKKT
ncbi:MAG TPA: hypothetical protein VGW39_14225 [Chthoniobacterales bacterium]|nr:hypothetical protein [Chthoniobacterales bacterium]